MNELDTLAFHRFCRKMDILAGIATVAIIVAIPLVLVWIFK